MAPGARRRRRGRRRRPGPAAVAAVVATSVMRTVSGEAGSGQGEDGERRHEDFLVVVRFITSFSFRPCGPYAWRGRRATGF